MKYNIKETLSQADVDLINTSLSHLALSENPLTLLSAYCGTKELTLRKNEVTFNTCGRFNRVTLRYNENTDLYTMIFTFKRGRACRSVQFDNLFCDQLFPLFYQQTGLTVGNPYLKDLRFC